MIPPSNLYKRAEDICKQIPFSEIESTERVDEVPEALFKKEALPIVSSACSTPIFKEFCQNREATTKAS